MDNCSMALKMEARNLCAFDPESGEFVQVEYLCAYDSSMSNEEIIEKIGGIKAVGMSNDIQFMNLGLYPIFVMYEKDGKVKRAKENSLDGFQKNGDSYVPVGNGLKIVRRLWFEQQKATA